MSSEITLAGKGAKLSDVGEVADGAAKVANAFRNVTFIGDDDKELTDCSLDISDANVHIKLKGVGGGSTLLTIVPINGQLYNVNLLYSGSLGDPLTS